MRKPPPTGYEGSLNGLMNMKMVGVMLWLPDRHQISPQLNTYYSPFQTTLKLSRHYPESVGPDIKPTLPLSSLAQSPCNVQVKVIHTELVGVLMMFYHVTGAKP